MAGVVVLFAQLFGNFKAGVAVVLEEAQKIFALDEVHLAGVNGLGGQFVRFSRDSSAKPENLAGLGNFQDQSLAVGGANG